MLAAADILDSEDVDALQTIPYAWIEETWADMLAADTTGSCVARDLARHDRFFLLTQLLHRPDALHPWLYARCREVEAAPDDHLDLWSREHYKDLADSTPMLTANRGWTTHGELVPGDMVFSPTGAAVQVEAVTPQYLDSECYQIRFSDGASIVAGAGHLWRIRQKIKHRVANSNTRRLEFVEHVVSTADIVARPHVRVDIGVADPIEYPVAQLPLHPYLLGVWLGDGHSAAGRITGEDEEVFTRIAELGYRLSKPRGITRTVFGISAVLRQIGVLNAKAVPESFLCASVNQRMELLRGLMDTDGHCNTRGTATFCNADEGLSRQVYDLAAGLGLQPHIRQYSFASNAKKAVAGRYGYWQVSFQAHQDRNPFFLPRKSARAIPPSHYRGCRTVVAVERIPSVPTRCIQVEGGMYVAGRELLPTHNSTIITFAGVIQEILRDPEVTIGIFSFNKPTARKFLRQIKYELETNADLKGLFPEILWDDPKRESPRWSEDGGIVVKRQGNPKEATVEGHGLVDGQPTGAHFLLRVYDDVVTLESVTSPEMVKKTTEAWSLSDNLGARGEDGRARCQHVGTRYCTVAGTKILMADWSHKRIEDVRTGDEVVGWELRGGKRWLRRATVKATGTHKEQAVNTYLLENGRSVTCTPDHRWWRGARGSGDEYQTLAVPAENNRRRDGVVAVGNPSRVPGQRRGISFLCELLAPVEADQGRDAGWLAGMFDGEGTTKKNKNHPSGIPCIIQTMHNPEIVDELRAVLGRLRFEYAENWISPSSEDGHHRQERCTFSINGGWRERYRFLAQINPSKKRALSPTLYGQLTTNKRKLVSVASAGRQDVFWLETETGNYVADGFCSKNSFRDTYQDMLDMSAVTPRIYPATDNGLPDGNPVFLSPEVWREKRRKQISSVLAAQMLQNPAAGNEATFKKEWLKFIDIRPATLNIYILADPASSKKKGSDSTAIPVVGIDSAGNKWLVDGLCHKMGLSERWQAVRGLRRKWLRMPGVQMVRVGYERYGSTADLEYFEEQMRLDNDAFEIVELAWPREGPGAKDDRIQRLEPDFRNGHWYLPARVAAETKAQARVREQGQAFRIFTPPRGVDHNKQAYSLVKVLLDQYLVHPFAKHDDFIDALSRIYDMEPVAPILIDQSMLEPEMYEDGT